ncbi:terminase [Variovorax sp. 38R]|uniref:terminase n=1 Tax=Variovorax sp. 38R TaxID=2774875 RepID=UPI001CE1CB63|nr:terminase [Variovorax sp. 38R]
MAGRTRVVHDTPLRPLPTNAEELQRCLADPEWRLFSGCLYKIMVKGDDAEEGEPAESFVLPFKPNGAQRRFLRRLWHRNLILKARQLGFTTLIAILWLDHALFNADQRCGIIAQDREAAEAIFRDKVKFAYENLPEEIRQRFPLARDSAVELLFAHNNSSVRVATSMRSGTIHRLHISEFGKICAKYPEKAQEVVTGSIPAVPKNGILVIESTAEGQEGEFFDIAKRAQALHFGHRVLTVRDYRFHFYAWWQEPNYTMDPGLVPITVEQHEYFERIEEEMACKIDMGQRAWYVATQQADFPGKEERMWQEYPSTPDEAFQVSTEGNYYAKDMVKLRKRGGITAVPVLDLPVYTFWDIGNKDGTAIWFMQELRGEARFIRYYEEHNEDLRHYAAQLKNTGYLFGAHFLPHDADHKRLGDFNHSTRDQLQALLPGHTFFIVPAITELMSGISMTRKHLKGAWFDQEGCKQGMERIQGYKKKFSRSENRYLDQPDKSNGCTEAADALRQWAQAKENGLLASMTDTNSYQEAPALHWRV